MARDSLLRGWGSLVPKPFLSVCLSVCHPLWTEIILGRLERSPHMLRVVLQCNSDFGSGLGYPGVWMYLPQRHRVGLPELAHGVSRCAWPWGHHPLWTSGGNSHSSSVPQGDLEELGVATNSGSLLIFGPRGKEMKVKSLANLPQKELVDSRTPASHSRQTGSLVKPFSFLAWPREAKPCHTLPILCQTQIRVGNGGQREGQNDSYQGPGHLN
jgi:hypothetical protein